MSKMIAKILLISDPHWMIVPPWKQKGQTDKGLAGKIVEFFISIWKLFNKKAFKKALSKISRMGSFEKVIFLGDLAECEWNERGMILPNDITELKKLKKLIEKLVNATRVDFHYIPGDHELGYILPLSCDPNGGVSRESIKNFELVFGPVFSSFELSDICFFLLSSSLLTQKLEDPKLQQLKTDQFEMLDSALKKIPKEKNVFIFLHDPDGLQTIENHFSNLRAGFHIFTAFCGHMHAEESLKKYKSLGQIANAKSVREKILRLTFNQFGKGKKVMEWAKGNLLRMEIFRKYYLQIVPSTAGMMGKGGGFVIFNLFEDGGYQIEKHNT